MPKKDELPENPTIPCQVCARLQDWPSRYACVWLTSWGERVPDGCTTQKRRDPVTGQLRDYPLECPLFVPSKRWKKQAHATKR